MYYRRLTHTMKDLIYSAALTPTDKLISFAKTYVKGT